MPSKNEQLADRLETARFFSDLDQPAAEALRDEIQTNGYSGVFGHDGRFAMVDAEELAEGGVAEWLQREIAPLLEKRSVALPVVEGFYPEDASGHYVMFDGVEHWMWRADETNNEGDAWGLAVVRAFELINRYVEQAGLAERLYAVGGGNDGSALLLTHEQATVLQSADIPKREQPYFPVVEPEWFGQPH